jgi:hypothetical protein
MTSAGTFSERLTKVDDLTRPDHFFLTPDDACYFLGEYTARKGYAFSATNQLILNFKKTLDKRGTAQWRYKDRAIGETATAFRTALTGGLLDRITLVPIPPSKAKGDPLYDDRLVRMLDAIRPQPRLDIRELILQRVSTAAVHGQANRPRPDEIQANYAIDGHACRSEAANGRTCRRRADHGGAFPRRVHGDKAGLSRCASGRPLHRPSCAGGRGFRGRRFLIIVPSRSRGACVCNARTRRLTDQHR